MRPDLWLAPDRFRRAQVGGRQPAWLKCDTFLYCGVNVAKPLTTRVPSALESRAIRLDAVLASIRFGKRSIKTNG